MNYKDQIKSLGITKQKVAEKLGISNVLLSYYLNNVRPIPEHIEKKLKELLSMYSSVL